MAININLDEVEFYKEDYESTGKVYLAGSITGLDSSKQYCVWWACEMSDMGLYVHYNDSMDYFFINQVSSVSFGSNAHIHSDSIIQSPGDYSLLGVYILEVEGNCETYVSGVLASTSLLFYHDYETPELTGIVSLDKTSYEQGELITATWSSANFTGGMFSVINPSGSVKKQLPVNSSIGMVYYELPSDAPLGNWSAVLDYEDIEVDSKTFSVTESQVPPEPCTQHFRVEDQDENPISCVIYSGYWDFDLQVPSTGEISVSLPPNETYEIVAHSVEHNVEDRKTITTCTTSPVVFVLDISVEPKCIDYTTQSECEANGCYWWSDNTCQSTPDGTTEYLDVYIKPYPWYDGKYEEAISNTLQKVTELTGKITNYMSTITGYEYKGIDILEEQNQEVVVVRIYFAEIPETSLMPPLIIGGILGIIAGILLLSIGYIIGTSESEFSKKEVIVEFDDACDKAINECKERYPDRTTIKEEAANFKHCVGGIETVRIIGSSDVVEEDYSEHVDYVINPVIIDLDEKLDDGTLLPEDIDAAINDNLTIPTKEVVDLHKDKVRDEDCAWELFDTCIISKKALKTLTWGAIGIGTIYTLSTIKNVTKK